MSEIDKLLQQYQSDLIHWLEQHFLLIPEPVLTKIKAIKNLHVIENLRGRLSNFLDRDSLDSKNLVFLVFIVINKIQLEENYDIYKMTKKHGPQIVAQRTQGSKREMKATTVCQICATFDKVYLKSSTIRKLYDSGRITWNDMYQNSKKVNICELEKRFLEKAKLSADELESVWIALRKIMETLSESSINLLSYPDSLMELQDERRRLEEENYFDDKNIEDARRRILASIVQRQGQSKFRRKLITAYGGRCPITGCDVEQALEAAHIIPYRGTRTNHLTNGLLLRADIHTLFDLHLLSIQPETYEIIVASDLSTSCYQELAGRRLSLPIDKTACPSKGALGQHYDNFLQKQKAESVG